MKKTFSLFLLTFLVTMGFTQSCLLDSTFGIGGKAIGHTSFGLSPYSANIIIQPDGKIIQAGSLFSTSSRYDFTLIRYNSNGNLDQTFGTNGIVTTAFDQNNEDYLAAAILQADGKIVVVGNSYSNGNSDFALARYKINGSLDTTFGIDGKTLTALGPDQDYATSVTIQSDGKIIVAGSTQRIDTVLCDKVGYYVPVSVIVRFNTNGSMDSSFGKSGKIFFPIEKGYDFANAVAIQPDEKIVVASTSYYNCGCGYYGGVECYDPYLVLTRLNSNGSVDSTFGKNGKTTDSFLLTNPSSMVLQPDGKILVTGRGSKYGFIVERYNNNGRLDSSFGVGGKVFTIIGRDNIDGAWSRSVTIQPDGRILLAGGFALNKSNISDFAVVRYKANGSLDSTFYSNGKALVHMGSSGSYDEATGVAMQGNKIIAGGYSNANNGGRLLVARLADSINTIEYVITTSGPNTFCEGGRVTLFSKADGYPQWYRNGILINSATDTLYTASSNGSYTVSNRCGTSRPLVVTVNANPPQPPINWNSIQFSTSTGYSKYQWYLNGTAIEGATGSSYEPVQGKVGFYKVTVTNNANCSNTSVEFNLVITGITDVTIGDTKIRYYPNPAQKMLFVDIPEIRRNKLRAELYDLTGRPIQKYILTQSHNELSLQHLPSGVYQLMIYSSSEKVSIKVVLIK